VAVELSVDVGGGLGVDVIVTVAVDVEVSVAVIDAVGVGESVGSGEAVALGAVLVNSVPSRCAMYTRYPTAAIRTIISKKSSNLRTSRDLSARLPLAVVAP
jgi:hypothetical protein